MRCRRGLGTGVRFDRLDSVGLRKPSKATRARQLRALMERRQAAEQVKAKEAMSVVAFVNSSFWRNHGTCTGPASAFGTPDDGRQELRITCRIAVPVTKRISQAR